MLSNQELAALLEAADEAQSFHGRGVGQARQQLYDLAPALAQEVLDRREAGQAVYEVVMKHAYAEGHDLTGPPRGCKPCRAALARWAELTETEVRDGV